MQRKRALLILYVVVAIPIVAKIVQHVALPAIGGADYWDKRPWYLNLTSEEVLKALGKPDEVTPRQGSGDGWAYQQGSGGGKTTLNLSFVRGLGSPAPVVDGSGWLPADPRPISEVLSPDLLRKGPDYAAIRLSPDGRFRQRFRLQFSLDQGTDRRAWGITCVGGTCRKSYDYRQQKESWTLARWKDARVVSGSQQLGVNPYYSGEGEFRAEGWGGATWVGSGIERRPLLDRYVPAEVVP